MITMYWIFQLWQWIIGVLEDGPGPYSVNLITRQIKSLLLLLLLLLLLKIWQYGWYSIFTIWSKKKLSKTWMIGVPKLFVLNVGRQFLLEMSWFIFCETNGKNSMRLWLGLDWFTLNQFLTILILTNFETFNKLVIITDNDFYKYTNSYRYRFYWF